MRKSFNWSNEEILLSISLSSEDSEEVKEYGDNVSVEDDSTENVIIDLDFISLSSHNKLGVKEEIKTENQYGNTTNYQMSHDILSQCKA